MHIKKKDYRAMQDRIAQLEETVDKAFTVIQIKALHAEAQSLKIEELEERIAQMQERAEIYEKIILEAKVLILPESHPEEEVRYAIQDIEYIRECGEDY